MVCKPRCTAAFSPAQQHPSSERRNFFSRTLPIVCRCLSFIKQREQNFSTSAWRARQERECQKGKSLCSPSLNKLGCIINQQLKIFLVIATNRSNFTSPAPVMENSSCCDMPEREQINSTASASCCQTERKYKGAANATFCPS